MSIGQNKKKQTSATRLPQTKVGLGCRVELFLRFPSDSRLEFLGLCRTPRGLCFHRPAGPISIRVLTSAGPGIGRDLVLCVRWWSRFSPLTPGSAGSFGVSFGFTGRGSTYVAAVPGTDRIDPACSLAPASRQAWVWRCLPQRPGSPARFVEPGLAYAFRKGSGSGSRFDSSVSLRPVLLSLG